MMDDVLITNRTVAFEIDMQYVCTNILQYLRRLQDLQ